MDNEKNGWMGGGGGDDKNLGERNKALGLYRTMKELILDVNPAGLR